jgi:hypothetical protein
LQNVWLHQARTTGKHFVDRWGPLMTILTTRPTGTTWAVAVVTDECSIKLGVFPSRGVATQVARAVARLLGTPFVP